MGNQIERVRAKLCAYSRCLDRQSDLVEERRIEASLGQGRKTVKLQSVSGTVCPSNNDGFDVQGFLLIGKS